MAYNTKKIENQALDAIAKNDLLFVEDVAPFIDCTLRTFYDKQLHRSEEILHAFAINKAKKRFDLRKKMLDSDHPADRKLLYNIVATREESDAINNNKTEISLKENTPLEIKINTSNTPIAHSENEVDVDNGYQPF